MRWVKISKKTSSEPRKNLEKFGLQPRREPMNITSNLHVSITYLNKLSGWSDEKLQIILSSWQYKTTTVKLMNLSMYTVREKDYFAGFDCAVKDGNKLMNILNL